MDIVNLTARPLAIPLPGGKKLRLGPRKTGQITPKAAQHPPVQKLVEAGEVELHDGGSRGGGPSGSGGGSGGSGNSGRGPGQHSPSGGVRHTGDR